MSLSTVSATIQDPSGQAFANGTWQLVFKPSYSAPGLSTDGGVAFTKIYGGSLDGTGSFSQAVNRNDTIAPAGSHWTLIVTPNASGQAYSVDLNVNSGAFNASAAINAVITNIQISATPIAHAYKDSEIAIIPSSGSQYYDTVNKVLKIWDTSLGIWQSFSSPNSLGGRIFVDGIKYPLTQVGIQQAINDACAVTAGGNPGTTLFLPPCLINSTIGYTVTQPIKIIGAGPGQTALVVTGAGPVFRLRPATNNSQNQEWEYTGMELICSAGDIFLLDDSSGFGVDRFYLHDNVCQPGVNNWVVNTSISIANNAFDITIERNYCFGGINLQGNNTLGTVDGVYIANNTFDPNLGSTTAAIVLNQMAGAAQATIFHNRGGLSGGFLISAGCTQPKITYNQIEITTGSGSSNNAIIDLTGSTYVIDGAAIIGNNINAHNQVVNCIRLNQATNCYIDGNVLSLKSGGGGVGILTTAASQLILGLANAFNLAGGTAISGTGSVFQTTAPLGFFIGAPATNVPRVLYNNGNTGFEYELLNTGNGIAGLQTLNFDLFEGAGLAGLAGHTRIWADSVTHSVKINPNNAGAQILNATVASDDKTAQSATVGPITMVTGTPTTGGHYWILAVIECTVGDASGATVVISESHTSDGIALTTSSPSLSLASAVNTVQRIQSFSNVDASTNITYTATVTGVPVTAKFSVHVSVIKL